MEDEVPTAAGAVFDHSGLCISRGTDFASAEALGRASEAVRLLLRCRLLTAKGGAASANGGSSLAASLDPSAVASPFLPRTRSGASLNQRPQLAYESSTLGSSLGTEAAAAVGGSGREPTSVTIESTGETLHVQATESHISVIRVPAATPA